MRQQNFIAGGGEMGALIRAYDWASHPLGSPDGWPQSLRSAISICLGSRFPIVLWWGPELFMLYNDAYRPMLGTSKHPGALGQAGRACWPEIWHIIRPMLEDTVLRDGGATWSDDQVLLLERSGFAEECYFTFTYSPIRDESGGVGGVFCAVIETTERVIGERRLRLLKNLAERTLNAFDAEDACTRAADVIAEAPRDLPFALIYLFDHERCGRLVARAGDTLDFDPPARIIRGDDVTRHVARQALLAPIAAAGQPEPTGILVAGLNPQRPLDDAYRGFVGLVAGQIAGAVADARALETERARAEALAQLDRAKTAFFSNVSHEFRTPLTLMLGPTEQALASPTRTLDGEALERLHRNELRLLKLVNTLLDFARIEAGRADVLYEPTDLAAFTADLASAFRSAIETAGLTFDVACPPLPGDVYVDRRMWEKIVLNLLSNALKFTLRGGVRVSLRAAGDRIELAVADTGTGIPEHELPRVFDRFHRIEGAQARTHEGSGIGLALVQDLVKLHGGEITVTSRMNEGSTFVVSLPAGTAHLPPDRVATPSTRAAAFDARPYVTEALGWLPRAPEHDRAPTAFAPPAAAPTLVGGRVLVADDNADMRAYLASLLEPFWTVETVPNGTEALASIERSRPDLVLADVMMPGLDGFGLLRAIRGVERTKLIPVILVSARAGEESRVEGIAAGADDYIVKPFAARELLARVGTHLHLGQVRRAVAAERSQLYALFEEAPAAIAVLTGPEHRVAFANTRYCAFAGRSRARLMDHPMIEAFPELAGSELFDVLDRVFATGESARNPEFKVVWDRDHESRSATAYFDWTCQAVRDADGHIVGTAQFLFDVTPQLEIRRELDRARAAAEAASRAKDEFLAMLGHELRNPLSPIQTALQLMAMKGVTSRETAVIGRQVTHLTRLVDDLMDVARIARGKIELRSRTVQLAAVVERAIELAGPLLEKRRHRLHVDVARTGLPVTGDPDRLAQVVTNLLTNAAKYSDPETRITVTAACDRDGVRLSVRDEGIGIPPHMLESIFDTFVQQPQALDRASGGLGLGLAIVKSLVALHGGTVSAHSAGVGTGSEFVVELPLATADPDAPGDNAAVDRRRTEAAGTRVLVVDDNRDAAEMLAALLRALHYDVQIAHDAASALEAAGRFDPQIALLDLGLPVINGYELARQLAGSGERTGDLRLIAVTGYGQDADRRKTEEAGFAAHLVKPVTLEALTSALETPASI